MKEILLAKGWGIRLKSIDWDIKEIILMKGLRLKKKLIRLGLRVDNGYTESQISYISRTNEENRLM